MRLLKSLLLGASLASYFVNALPSQFPEPNVSERDDIQLLSRDGNKLFANHGSYDKQKAVDFVKNIPLASLQNLGNTVSTLYSVDKNGQVPKLQTTQQTTGFRLDNQGTTSSGHHNLQVQINGHRNDNSKKTTIGGILVKGDMPPKKIQKHLVHAIMHPNKDSKGNEYLYTPAQKDGKAPINAAGRKLSNAEARKKQTPRRKFNPKSKKNRKAARKASYQ